MQSECYFYLDLKKYSFDLMYIFNKYVCVAEIILYFKCLYI